MRGTVLVVAVAVGSLTGCAIDPLTECLQQCDGCCSVTGVCQGGDTASACGPRAATCSVCEAQQICSAGSCITPVCQALTGYYFLITPSNARFTGNTATCTGSAADQLPASMTIDFAAVLAEFRANGALLFCNYTANNCSVAVNCGDGYAEISNMTVHPSMAAFTGDMLIRRANDECNIAFTATGSR